MDKSYYRKPNMFFYRFTQALSWCASKILFNKKILRNELKGKKGPIIVIANHQAALDFVNLIGATNEPMSFVISNSFYSTMPKPVTSVMNKIGVIPKQQFQTSIKDVHAMKSVIDEGKILVVYPAGLMCEDGLSTPIPAATYRFLQWLQADIYVAKTYGTYFCTPKWALKRRRGKTYLDVYKLFSKEELAKLTTEEVRSKAEEALLFDAYRDQEDLKIKYSNGSNVEGLENVLYVCPNCGQEFTIQVKNKRSLYCTECGFEEECDEYGFLHKKSDTGTEIRYVSDWSRYIYTDLEARIARGEQTSLSCGTTIRMVDRKGNKFIDLGEGTLTLESGRFLFKGKLNGEETEANLPTASFASLPFKPGKYIEIQHGEDIYRCILDDGRLAMKFINMIKIYYEIHQATHSHAT